MPVLCQGKLHIEYIGQQFHGDDPRSMAKFVQKLRAAINIRFQGSDQPSTVFTDKGKGFYQLNNSLITPEYKAALGLHGFRAFAGEDASIQPGNLQEAMLHETAVAWIRERLKKTLPKCPWDEGEAAYAKRLKSAATYINENFNVDGLNREFPQRAAAIALAGGGRIPP